MTSPTIIPLNRAKLGGLLILSLLFVAQSGWLFTLDVSEIVSDDDQVAQVITSVIGLVGIAFFGPAAVVIAYKFFDSKPGLVFSADGFIDNSSAIAAGFVPWTDVVKLKNSDVFGQRSLIVSVNDPDKYIKRFGPIRGMFVRANNRWWGGPIAITANTLRIRQSELFALFQSHLDAHVRDASV